MVEAELLSRTDAAAKLGGVSVRTVDRLCTDGLLKKKRVRGRAMITLASYERYLGKKSEAGHEGRDGGKREHNWDGFELPALDRELERRRHALEQDDARAGGDEAAAGAEEAA